MATENERAIYNTENEPTLFKPRDNSWKEMAEECVDCGVGVTMVLAPGQWIDVATIGKFGCHEARTPLTKILTGIVPKLSGGDIFFHPKYDPERDFIILASQIRRLVDRETGYQATLRLRCTTGKDQLKDLDCLL